MFITLPKIFSQMPMGRLFAFLFFLSVLFAGITSLVNMLEVCSEAVSSHLNLNRKKAVIAVATVVFFISVFIEYEVYLSAWMDIITIYVVPFGALLGAIMIYWILRTSEIEKELNVGRKKPLGKVFRFFARYVYIPLTILVFILGIAYGGIG